MSFLKININQLKEDLKKTAKKVDPEDVVKWDALHWLKLTVIAGGMNPFQDAVKSIVPPTYRAFLPENNFVPSAQDRANAAQTLVNALIVVNAAVIHAAKAAYEALLGNQLLAPQLLGSLPGGLEQLAAELQNDLFDYHKRKLYFQTGQSMMSNVETWVGKHHMLAVGVLAFYENDPTQVITEEVLFDFAEDLEITIDGAVHYNPLAKEEKKKDPLLDALLGSISKDVKPFQTKSKDDILTKLDTNLKKKT